MLLDVSRPETGAAESRVLVNRIMATNVWNPTGKIKLSVLLWNTKNNYHGRTAEEKLPWEGPIPYFSRSPSSSSHAWNRWPSALT